MMLNHPPLYQRKFKIRKERKRHRVERKRSRKRGEQGGRNEVRNKPKTKFKTNNIPPNPDLGESANTCSFSSLSGHYFNRHSCSANSVPLISNKNSSQVLLHSFLTKKIRSQRTIISCNIVLINIIMGTVCQLENIANEFCI